MDIFYAFSFGVQKLSFFGGSLCIDSGDITLQCLLFKQYWIL
jgi:hypothetical protein